MNSICFKEGCSIVYDGLNLKEVEEFCHGQLSYQTKEMEWDSCNPPEDLVIKVSFANNQELNVGDIIAKHGDEFYLYVRANDGQI